MSLTTAQKQILHSCPDCQHGIANHESDGCGACLMDQAREGGMCVYDGRTILTTYAAVEALLGDASPHLLPVESLALTVALAQIEWGDTADDAAATRCILALARITGRYDWMEGVS